MQFTTRRGSDNRALTTPLPETAAASRVLLVDDDVQLAGALAEVLRRQGYAVVLARHGREAGRLLDRERVALVISDIFMPEGDGIELIAKLRTLTPQPAVLAMSGAGVGRVGGMLEMAAHLGATRTLAKPFTGTELIQVVEQLIGPAEAPPVRT